MSDLRVNDYGTVFTVTVEDENGVVNLSAATTKEIIFRKPGSANTTLTAPASFVTDGSDGKISYTFGLGDLSAAGKWQWQVHVVLPSGEWSSSVQAFEVKANL
jgi:hypothetical protein